MPAVVLLPRAEVQVADVLSYTLEELGEAKYLEYREPSGGVIQKSGSGGRGRAAATRQRRLAGGGL